MASSVGRHAIEIDMDKVAEMRRIGMSITKSCELMGISKSTLYRALENYGFTDISNAELDKLVTGYKFCGVIFIYQDHELGNAYTEWILVVCQQGALS